jgi:chromosome segregation ATPase
MSGEWYKVCKSTIDAQIQQLNRRTEDAERKAAAGEEFCRILSVERDGLLAERDNLLETLRESAATLTKVDTQGMETNEILKKVRAEKEDVENRKGALEMDLAYLQARIQQMDEELGEYSTALEEKSEQERNLKTQLDAELNNNAALSDQLMRREEQIQDLNRKLGGRDETIQSLNHSIDTKTRQLHVIIKERDRLRSEKELSAKKVLVHTKRQANLKELTSPGMASPISHINVSRVSTSSAEDSPNTTLDTSHGSPVISSPVEAFAVGDKENSMVMNKNKEKMTKSKILHSYENMTVLMRAIEEVCKVELDKDEQDPLSWLKQEKPSEETRMKVMRVIMKKQEEEIRKLKATTPSYAK